jgi:PKD repeat protein
LVDNNNYTVTKTVQVNGPEMITASFTSSSNNVLEMQDVVLTSTTPSASTYSWDFGNGQTGSGQTVTENYASAGVYTVVLNVTNASGCTANTAQTITVNAITTTAVSNVTDNRVTIWGNENKVYVDFRGQDKTDAVICIYDVLGRQISNEKFTNNLLYVKEINNIEAAYMIVSVKNDDKIITRKVFINNYR